MENSVLFTSTCVFNSNDGTWDAVNRYSLDQKINFRSTHSGYHILSFNRIDTISLSHSERKSNYEFRCLERGVRPFHYTDEQWEEYLSAVRNEEATVRCENRNSWMYQL